MRRGENNIIGLKYFIDPTLRPEVRQLNTYINRGILEKDEFLKYIYDNLENCHNFKLHFGSIAKRINWAAEQIRTTIREAIQSGDYTTYWDRSNSKGYYAKMEYIKKTLDDTMRYIHIDRELTIKTTIDELWEDALAYGVKINPKAKSIYEIIYLSLFISASYDKQIENAMRELSNIRKELYSIISSQTIFDNIDNWKRSMLYDKAVVWIDNFIYDYNKFDEERKAARLQFARKI